MCLGALRRWSQLRADWFGPHTHVTLELLQLLELWSLAFLQLLLVLFGLWQVADRLEAGLTSWLTDTPFLVWLPVRLGASVPLSALAERFAWSWRCWRRSWWVMPTHATRSAVCHSGLCFSCARGWLRNCLQRSPTGRTTLGLRSVRRPPWHWGWPVSQGLLCWR